MTALPLTSFPEEAIAKRLAASSTIDHQPIADLTAVRAWYADRCRTDVAEVRRIPLAELVGWRSDPATGNIVHDSGRFFTVEGVEVHHSDGPVPTWSQPIIHQREIGLLGILIKDFGGVLHCLMQAKNEPGNCNGVQLSPTVQATRSNYTRVHRGNAVPYLEHFQAAAGRQVVADVLQSEQGSWFYQKRNRNMVVEVREDIEVLDGFHWMTLGQVHTLLAEDHVINMDARTVLSCLPFATTGLAGDLVPAPDSPAARLARSCSPEQGSRHSTAEVLSWITEARSRHELRVTRIPLNQVPDWERRPNGIVHRDGRFLSVVAVDVRAHHREVAAWTQPLIEPHGVGVAAFFVRSFDGVLHVLARARVEPGFVQTVELGPTVQCTPENYDGSPDGYRPRYLDDVLAAAPERILYDAELSEEGGRFLHARNRYVVLEVDDDWAGPASDDPDFRWLTMHQLVELLRHSHYVNVQARTLVACLQSLFTLTGADR
ncbi:NDP-hexose 2,3-dehydratase family protein [Micromonospora sp. FIMYZ51]|uniref:NDP-hexose 2,3-dehydratase family protein n=1 Tax=Micromonospora sp. FIMYZ51 TaxID=3051832 RepID=UPI00311D7D72